MPEQDAGAAHSAFKPRTDTMLHFIHDSLHGAGGLADLVRYEMPFPKCNEKHDAVDHAWWCDAAEWVLNAAARHPEIMAALNERAAALAAALGTEGEK